MAPGMKRFVRDKDTAAGSFLRFLLLHHARRVGRRAIAHCLRAPSRIPVGGGDLLGSGNSGEAVAASSKVGAQAAAAMDGWLRGDESGGQGTKSRASIWIRTGSNKQELNSKKKLEKKLSFYTKVKDTVTSLNAKKAISKKKKQRSRQKKLKAYDFSELSEFLPGTASSQQPTEGKLNCKSKQALVQRESAQLNAVLNNPQFQLDPFAAIHRHLVLTQPPSSIKEDEPAKTGKKSRKDKKRKKKKKNSNNALSTPQSMDI